MLFSSRKSSLGSIYFKIQGLYRTFALPCLKVLGYLCKYLRIYLKNLQLYYFILSSILLVTSSRYFKTFNDKIVCHPASCRPRHCGIGQRISNCKTRDHGFQVLERRKKNIAEIYINNLTWNTSS